MRRANLAAALVVAAASSEPRQDKLFAINAARHAAAQPPFVPASERTGPAACTPPCNGTEFLYCPSRVHSYGAAWLAHASLPAKLPLFRDKRALEYATYHVHQTGHWSMKDARDDFWVNHVSAYEHSLEREEFKADASRRVNEMVDALAERHCGDGAAPRRPAPGPPTLLVVPYYGGAVRGDLRSNATSPDTGNAHSNSDRATKVSSHVGIGKTSRLDAAATTWMVRQERSTR